MNRYDPEKHRRRSIRLKRYDYAQPGGYFVTICTYERAHLFGQVVDGEMVLNAFGRIVGEEWFRSAEIRAEIELYPDEFVIMPNHIHGIVWIVETDVGAHGRAPLHNGQLSRPPRSLGAFVAGFKSIVTKRINALRGTPGAPVWQRNYYEHIIRTEWALHAIRQYIADNPLRWHLDRYNPAASGADPLARDLWRLLQEDARPREDVPTDDLDDPEVGYDPV
nr:MAG: hypothetical protein KatS3mg041_1876 [Bacteroidota bacterium]